jgi:hypothetical protein
MDLIRLMTAVEIDYTSREDVCWGNEVFQGVMCVQVGLWMWVYPEVEFDLRVQEHLPNEERDVVLQLVHLAAALLRLPFVTHQTLRLFYPLARFTGHVCSPRNNVTLNARPMHELLAKCQDSSRPKDLQEAGRTTLALLKGR